MFLRQGQLKEAYIHIGQRCPQLQQTASTTASPSPDPGASSADNNPGPSPPCPRAEHKYAACHPGKACCNSYVVHTRRECSLQRRATQLMFVAAPRIHFLRSSQQKVMSFLRFAKPDIQYVQNWEEQCCSVVHKYSRRKATVTIRNMRSPKASGKVITYLQLQEAQVELICIFYLGWNQFFDKIF